MCVANDDISVPAVYYMQGGATTLMYAALCASCEIVKLLLKQGARVDHRDDVSRT